MNECIMLANSFDFPLHVFYIYGDTGTGKTYFTQIFYELLNFEHLFPHLRDGKYEIYGRLTEKTKVIVYDWFSEEVNYLDISSIIDNRSRMIPTTKSFVVGIILEFLFLISLEDYKTFYKKENDEFRYFFDSKIDIVLHFRYDDINQNIVINAEFRDFNKTYPIEIIKVKQYSFKSGSDFEKELTLIAIDIIEIMIKCLRSSHLFSKEKESFIKNYEKRLKIIKKGLRK